jgi:hypothetical protein
MKGEKILFPIGRLVMGSVYKANDKNAEGAPLTDKNGNPRVQYFIAYAIEKKGETHWSQTEWGKKIYDIGMKGFPNGQAQSPTFAWKIVDGDSQIPNKAGKKPCDREGYPGHWVLSFTNGFAPTLCNEQGGLLNKPEDFIKCGDFVQVYATVDDNGSQQQPGVYLNETHVAFIAYGERIVAGIDPTTIGFGGALPTGASRTPISSGFNPAASETPAPIAPAAPPAYPNILKPPKVLTAKAKGASYEDFIKQGWTDELLIQHGYLQG